METRLASFSTRSCPGHEPHQQEQQQESPQSSFFCFVPLGPEFGYLGSINARWHSQCLVDQSIVGDQLAHCDRTSHACVPTSRIAPSDPILVVDARSRVAIVEGYRFVLIVGVESRIAMDLLRTNTDADLVDDDDDIRRRDLVPHGRLLDRSRIQGYFHHSHVSLAIDPSRLANTIIVD